MTVGGRDMTPVAVSSWVVDRLRQLPAGGLGSGRAAQGPQRRSGRRDDVPRRRQAGCSARPGGSDRLTLELRLDSVWEGLRAEGAAECPVCRGRMEGTGPAHCADCGSELH